MKASEVSVNTFSPGKKKKKFTLSRVEPSITHCWAEHIGKMLGDRKDQKITVKMCHQGTRKDRNGHVT